MNRLHVRLAILVLLAVPGLAGSATAQAGGGGACGASGPATAPAPAPAAVTEVVAVAITVSDLDRVAAWYADVLAFEKVSERVEEGVGAVRVPGLPGARARVARLRLGAEAIELREFLAPRGRPFPRDARSQDRSFQHVAIVVSDMAAAHAVLARRGVEPISAGPQRLPDWNPAAGGIEAFYFRDPDGHPLELIRFPAGKGDPRWQRAAGRLFLGIDHTAIVVEDTEAALAFWRDALGFRVAGGSENHGPEQERLNAVPGARLRITALRAGAGPGVELLEYLAPRDGRPMPADENPADLLHRRVVVRAADPAALGQRLRVRGDAFVPSAGAGDSAPPVPAPFLVRDPSGHVVEVNRP